MKKILYTHVLILLTLFSSCDLLDIKTGKQYVTG